MKELLSRLKKAVDRAASVRGTTQEIALAEFPAYVVKSLETILADRDSERASSRLALLKAKVDEVHGLAKQSAGAAEDRESQRVTVEVFEEPGLTATPTVESETNPAAAGGAPGGSAVHAPNGSLGKALESLKNEVAELKALVGSGARKQEEDEEEDEEKRKGKPRSEMDEHKAKGKGDEKDEHKAKGSGDEEDREKAKDKGEEDKSGVEKSVGWPLDMNATMPGAEPVEKRNPELDWGADPSPRAEAQ